MSQSKRCRALENRITFVWFLVRVRPESGSRQDGENRRDELRSPRADFFNRSDTFLFFFSLFDFPGDFLFQGLLLLDRRGILPIKLVHDRVVVVFCRIIFVSDQTATFSVDVRKVLTTGMNEPSMLSAGSQ